jgi:aromatic ring-opening dioxygenase catalytic subunit (LigB family)
LETAQRCIELLKANRFDAHANEKFDRIHDTYLILIRMFPNGCPPTVLWSMNARYDPHFHMRAGVALRPLRKEGYLLTGTGGAVHNLYRNIWELMVYWKDNFAMERAPDGWALEFRQAFEDVLTKNSGPALRRAATCLMKHPEFRSAHGTDDHFMAALFVAGAVGDDEDRGTQGVFVTEDWELTNMCNSQFTFGSW